MYAWTAQEVYLSELINRARANPQAEALRLNLNLAQGLIFGEQLLLTAKEPLALSSALTTSARAHAADMGARQFFSHTNPDNLSPTNRARGAGYLGTAGENIGAGYGTIDALYRSWMATPAERKNILSLYTAFDSTYHYDQLGPGFAFGVTGAAYSSYVAADFGNPSAGARTPWLVGVVFADADNNQFYSIGEGLGAIRVDVFTGSTTTGSPTATYTTDGVGNYQVPLANGSYTIVFTRTSDNFRAVKTATVSGQNVRVSAMASELTTPPDDHANAGQWPGASSIAIDSLSGSGASSGALGHSGDTDLFSFVAAKSGVTTLSAIPTGAAFTGRIRIYNAAGSLLAAGSPGTPSATSVADVSLTSGSTYYVLVDANTTTGTGAYAIQIEGPPDASPVPIPDEFLGADGEPVSPTFLGGKPVIAFVNKEGKPVVAMRNSLGVWTSTDLRAATGAPAVSGELVTWVDSRDGLLYAAATSSEGVLVFKRDNSGAWTYRNLTTEIIVSRPIASNLTTFTDSAGLRQIAGLDAGGRLVTYWMTGLLWPRGWRYFFTDVAERDLARRGRIMPAVSGTVTSYVTQKNSLNVIATNSAGSVLLFFRPGGGLATQLWNWTNLTSLTGCAPLVGNITAAETTGKIVNITGTDAMGNVWMITWRNGEGWRSRNITAAAAGSPSTLEPGSVASWSNTAGAAFVAGLTSGGEIVLYRYTLTGGQHTWTFASVSAGVTNPPVLTGRLRAAYLSTGAISITGLTGTGEVVRYTFTPGGSSGQGTWAAESVSELLAP